MRQVKPRIREELDINLEEEDVEDYNRRCKKSSEYKINVDIIDFYGGMHVKEFLDWISDIKIAFNIWRFCRKSGLSWWHLN